MIIFRIFSRYLKKYLYIENQIDYYHIGDDMKEFFDKHLANVDKNKFIWNKESSKIIRKILIPKSELTDFQCENLTNIIPLFHLQQALRN